MPVIIARQDWSIWLREVEGDPTSLLHAAPEDVLRIWRVSKAVGNVKNDGAELINPVDAAESTLL
jgi:putative SOS response-associated peptidase YedK